VPLYMLWDLKWNRDWQPRHYELKDIPWLH